MSTISNENYESLLKILSSFVINGLDETISFNDKDEAAREEIIKASLKALEISSVITSKFFDSETFNHEKLKDVSDALGNKDFELANVIVNK